MDEGKIVDERRARPLALLLPLASVVVLGAVMSLALATDPGPTGPTPTASTASTSAPSTTAPTADLDPEEVAVSAAILDRTVLDTRRGSAGEDPPTAGTGEVTVGEVPVAPPSGPPPTPTYYYVWPDGSLTPVADGLPPPGGEPVAPSGPPTATASSDD